MLLNEMEVTLPHVAGEWLREGSWTAASQQGQLRFGQPKSLGKEGPCVLRKTLFLGPC